MKKIIGLILFTLATSSIAAPPLNIGDYERFLETIGSDICKISTDRIDSEYDSSQTLKVSFCNTRTQECASITMKDSTQYDINRLGDINEHTLIYKSEEKLRPASSKKKWVDLKIALTPGHELVLIELEVDVEKRKWLFPTVRSEDIRFTCGAISKNKRAFDVHGYN